MRSALSMLVMLFALSAPAFAAEPQGGSGNVDVEKALTDMRTDLQASRADIMAKNISLTAEQAAKFWPLFEQYQTEQNKIIDAQLEGIRKYAETYENLSDKDAQAFINAQLDRDDKMHALRIEWLGKFGKVLDAKTAARVIQIDRRLGQISQVMLSSRLPLIR